MFTIQSVLPSEISGGGSEKEDKNGVGVEDLDGTGVSTVSQKQLNPEKTNAIFMNLINVDEKAQVNKNCFHHECLFSA